MTTIQLRVDPVVKKKAQKVVESLGLDLSGALTMFLMQMILEEGIPFEVRTEKGHRLKDEARLRLDVEETIKKGKSYASADEAFTAVLGKEWKKK